MSKEPINQRKFPDKEKKDREYLGRRRSWFWMTPDKPSVASTKRSGTYSRITLAVGRRSSWMSSWGWSSSLMPSASTIDSHRLTIGTRQYKRAKK